MQFHTSDYLPIRPRGLAGALDSLTLAEYNSLTPDERAEYMQSGGVITNTPVPVAPKPPAPVAALNKYSSSAWLDNILTTVGFGVDQYTKYLKAAAEAKAKGDINSYNQLTAYANTLPRTAAKIDVKKLLPFAFLGAAAFMIIKKRR